MIREAGSDVALQAELAGIQVAIEKPKMQAVTALIKLLKTSVCRETQWFIGRVLGTCKDPRAIKPLMRAAIAAENTTHRCNFLWPLESFDCTKHLDFS